MNSLQELNNFNNSLSFTVVDNRLATVKFNTNVFYDKEINITSTSITVVPTFDITEIVNYITANCRFRITINSTSPAFIAASSITWPSLPPSVTLTSGGGVYTLSGLITPSDWDAVKNPTWTIPANYATYSKFWLTVAVIYYDEELATTVTKDIEIFDRDFYYSCIMSSLSSMTSTISLIKTTSSTMNSVFGITATGIDFVTAVQPMNVQFNMTCTVEKIIQQLVIRPRADKTKAFISSVYNPLTGNYDGTVEPNNGHLQNGWSRAIFGARDLVAVNAYIDQDEGGSFTTTFFRKRANEHAYDNIWTIEAFDYTIPPSTERNQYGIKDFKFRADGGAVILAGNPRGGPEIWSINSNFQFTRQPNLQPFGNRSRLWVALHPSGTCAASTGRGTFDQFDQSTPSCNLHLFNYNNSTGAWDLTSGQTANNNGYEPTNSQWTYSPTSSKLSPLVDATWDIDWDISGNYFAMLVNSTARIYHFNLNAKILTLLSTINLLDPYGKISWSPTGTYVAFRTRLNVFVCKRSGTGLSATFNVLYNFPITGCQGIDWKYDESLIGVATTTGIKNIYRSGDVFTYDATTNITSDTTSISFRKG